MNVAPTLSPGSPALDQVTMEIVHDLGGYVIKKIVSCDEWKEVVSGVAVQDPIP